MHPEDHQQMEQAAFQWSRAPETYDIACSAGHLLSTPCRTGFANVYQDGRNWHLAGGLISPPDFQPEMIRWLSQSADRQKLLIAVYSVSSRDVEHYRAAGYAVNKFGEEPILDLGHLDWRGGAYEWVRRQSNGCERAGLEVVEISDADEQRQLAVELSLIHEDDLSDRVYSTPLKLLEGEFDCLSLQRRRLFLARDRTTGRIEGFLAASPMNGGREWAFETYRKRRSSPRGTMPFLFRSVVDRMQKEGIERISLCLVPGKGVKDDLTSQTDSKIRWLLGLWYGHLNFLFNTAGQDFFKSRFRPRYEERYLCVYPRNSVFSFTSFLKVAGALSPNYKNLLRLMLPQSMRREAA